MTKELNAISLSVDLGERSYSIFVGSNLLDQVGELLKGMPRITHVVAIFDASVKGFASAVCNSCSHAGMRVSTIEVPSGESSKCSEQLSRIWMEMLAVKVDRAAVVIAIGGGVIGDLAGFAAATFVRGIRLIQVPTTLLAQVDSSVGGKTGINLPEAKNIVGAFWQPSLVIIDTDTLVSLPDREFRSGLAEVVKYGVILDEEFFSWLEQNAIAILDRDNKSLQRVITRCCEIKAQVVRVDERETTGARAVLNYGHTFGHALEAATGYASLLHGEAVAIGMAMAGTLAAELQMWDADSLRRQNALLQQFGLPTSCDGLRANRLVELMASDKKTVHGQIGFVLPKKIGHVMVGQTVDTQLVLATLRKCGCVASS